MSALDPTAEGEGDVDREIRIERMKRELEELAGGPMISGSLGEVPPELEELFLSAHVNLRRPHGAQIMTGLFRSASRWFRLRNWTTRT